jgi:peptidyl-prolyl cis-trans isomerase SurA
MVLQRLREREVMALIKPTDSEVNAYLREAEQGGRKTQILHLAHILVAVPESATAQQQAALQARADKVMARLRAGENFAQVALEVSEAPDSRRGGDLGQRPAERYPDLFVNAVADVPVAGLAGPIRSGAGWHMLKVLDRQMDGGLNKMVTQTRARHILLKPKADTSTNALRARLAQLKSDIDRGASDFATLAKQYSEDGSAAQGGDLGWASPGMFVPEFEDVMNRLAPGQVAEPVVSRFGVHLIQVIERRQVPMSERELREQARNALRESKFEQTNEDWQRGVRGRAYVEYRDPPQ